MSWKEVTWDFPFKNTAKLKSKKKTCPLEKVQKLI